MSINPKHLRTLINDTLETILPEAKSPEAVELLMLTAAQETSGGKYLQLRGYGMSFGIFLMHGLMYTKLFQGYLRNHQDILATLQGMFPISEDTFSLHMRGNIPYQIVLARLHYLSIPDRIPPIRVLVGNFQYDPLFAAEMRGLARYYLKYWNKNVNPNLKEGEVMRNYDKYAI